MIVRHFMHKDRFPAMGLVHHNWGPSAAHRAYMQMRLQLSGAYSPVFYTAEDDLGQFCGFSAFCPSMRMNGAYDLIWIAVSEHAQGKGVGIELTNVRLDEIRRRHGSLVSLVTQKPDYFEWKFGFKVVSVYDGWHTMDKRLSRVEM